MLVKGLLLYLGTANPVAADYFDFTFPEVSGVVGVVAPDGSSLLGLVSRLAPVVVSGNTAGFDWLDDDRAQRPEWIARIMEMKTVWHPIGV